MHHLKDDNGTLIITDRVKIANTLGAAIEKSSSSKNFSKEFQSIKALSKGKAKYQLSNKQKSSFEKEVCDERF